MVLIYYYWRAMKFLLYYYLIISFISNLVKALVIKGSAHHINGYTTLTGPSFITLPICIGTPNQCFNMLYANKQTFFLLCNTEVDRKADNKFDESQSKTYEQIEKRTYSLMSSDKTIKSKQVMDYIEFESTSKFHWLLICEMNFDFEYFDGILGLAFKTVLGDEFSFLSHLYHQKIISSFDFGHYFLNPNAVNIYFGEIPLGLEQYNYCFAKSTPALYCRTYRISMKTNNETLFIDDKARDIIINIGAQYLQASIEGKPLLDKYNDILDGHCHMVNKDSIYSFLECDSQANISIIPDVFIKMDDVTIKIRAADIFERNSNGYHCRLFIHRSETVWVLNLVVLRNYDIFFDNINSKIWFIENNMFPN